MYLSVIDQILGEDATTWLNDWIKRRNWIVQPDSIAPDFSLTDCQLDGLRFTSGGENSTCGCNSTSTDTFDLVLMKCDRFETITLNDLNQNNECKSVKYFRHSIFTCQCSMISAIPNIFATVEGKAYKERATCLAEPNANIGVIAGVVVGVLAVVVVCAYICLYYCKKNKNQSTVVNKTNDKPDSIKDKGEDEFLKFLASSTPTPVTPVPGNDGISNGNSGGTMFDDATLEDANQELEELERRLDNLRRVPLRSSTSSTLPRRNSTSSTSSEYPREDRYVVENATLRAERDNSQSSFATQELDRSVRENASLRKERDELKTETHVLKERIMEFSCRVGSSAVTELVHSNGTFTSVDMESMLSRICALEEKLKS